MAMAANRQRRDAQAARAVKFSISESVPIAGPFHFLLLVLLQF